MFTNTVNRNGTLVLCWTLTACSGEPAAGPATPPTPQPAQVAYGSVRERDRSGKADGADFTAVVNAQNALALRLLAALRTEDENRNLAVGAFSIHQVLGMLYAGARGQTATDIQTALGWTMPPERFHVATNALDLELGSRADDVLFTSANRLWAQAGLPLLPEFLDVLTRSYGAPLALADFGADPEGARRSVNDWIASATARKIPELFPAGSINSNTKLVLANGMYLDAPWKYRFNPTRTTDQPFTLQSGAQVMVKTMHFDEFLPSASGLGWQAVELPYRGDELSMVVIAPSDLRDFEIRFTPERLGDLLGQIKSGGIHLSLPRWTFSVHASLKKSLGSLGLGSLFEGADLSGITGSAGLSVQSFEHEVFVEVDEEGTKAAAATGAAIVDSHGPTIAINRPFLFLIRDRPTGAILFVGRVLDPR